MDDDDGFLGARASYGSRPVRFAGAPGSRLDDGSMIPQVRTATILVLAAATSHLACVSVAEYTQVAEQLQIEQRHSREAVKRTSQLELLAETLQKQLRVCTLERDEARERLRVARTSIPGVDEVARVAALGARGGKAAVLLGTIFFQSGRDTLSDGDMEQLRKIAERASALAGGEIVVSGHSDPTPIGKTTYQSNMHLSAVRALAVYHALVKMPGIELRRVSVAAYGEHKPAPPNVKKLRRVEITFIPDGE